MPKIRLQEMDGYEGQRVAIGKRSVVQKLPNLPSKEAMFRQYRNSIESIDDFHLLFPSIWTKIDGYSNELGQLTTMAKTSTKFGKIYIGDFAPLGHRTNWGCTDRNRESHYLGYRCTYHVTTKMGETMPSFDCLDGSGINFLEITEGYSRDLYQRVYYITVCLFLLDWPKIADTVMMEKLMGKVGAANTYFTKS